MGTRVNPDTQTQASNEFETTGIFGLDFVTNGLPDSALTMVTGAPGTGKTVLSQQMAMHAAAQGRHVVFLSAYSEPHEKLIQHMEAFSFFDRNLVGQQIELLSLKSVLHEGVESTMALILEAMRKRNRPLVILDGYRGMRNVLGRDGAQELVYRLSSQMPYHGGSCVVTSETDPYAPEDFAELSTADAIIALFNVRSGARVYRALQVLKMRGHAFLEGIHSMKITQNGVIVYPRLASCLPENDPLPTDRRQRFDLLEFDRMLGGGLPEFSTTTIYGDPGTGKTAFALQYLTAGARAGERGLLITFGETVPALLHKADQLRMDLAGAVRSEHVQIIRVPPVEIDPEELAWTVRTIVDEEQIQRLVIDGIRSLALASHGPGDSENYLAALIEYLRRSGTTTVMTQEGLSPLGMRLGSSHLPGVPTSDNRIILQRVEYRGALYRICSVLSMQNSAHETNIREFHIAEGGIHILEPSHSMPGVLAGIAQARSMDE